MTDLDWDRPWVFRTMMNSAFQRCHSVAASERFLGYEDNCLVYQELAWELYNLDMWVMQEMYRFPAA